MSTLYVVATPIGNLQDVSERSLDILKSVDLILAEDTRVTKNLLAHFAIKTPLISYHQHSRLERVEYILGLLKQGKDLALVSDAGTPGISDPGGKLIESILQHTFHGNPRSRICVKDVKEGIKIVPIPGPSALTAAASIAGFPMDRFLFLGFLPAKRKRKKFFEEVSDSKYPVIFYESPHRILRTLDELRDISKYRNIEISLVVGRELTKKFETIYRGTVEEVIQSVEEDKINGKVKGEFVVVAGCE